MSQSRYFKIGYSRDNNPEMRMASLQIGCPCELELIGFDPDGTREKEKLVQLQFIQYKTDGGNEWFNIPDEYTINEIKDIFDNPVYTKDMEFPKKNPQDISGNIIRITISFPIEVYNRIMWLAKRDKRSFTGEVIYLLTLQLEYFDVPYEVEDNDTKSSLSNK